MDDIDKLNSIATNNSDWLEDAKKRQKNKNWLKHSQKIAIKILRTLREKNIKQKELASMINVSPQQINKIVKGKENLTLETISKLEQALEISLIFIKNKDTYFSYKYTIPETNVFGYYKKQETNVNIKSDYRKIYDCFNQNLVNDKTENYG